MGESLPQVIFAFACIATNMFLAIHDPYRSGDVLLTQGQTTWGRREKPLLFYALAKENPAKGRVSRLLVGRVA